MSSSVFALLAVLSTPPVIEVGDDPALLALLEEAVRSNPDLAAFREEAAGAAARPAAAAALPDPMLSVAYVNDGARPSLGQNEFTTLGVVWTQELPSPGKRRLRGERERRGAEAAEQRAERARLDLVAEVRRAYHELVHTRETLVLQRELRSLAAQSAQAARERYAVGQGGQQDVLRAQVEVIRLDRLQAEQAAEEQARLAELNRLRARSPEEGFLTLGHPQIRPLQVETEALRERVMAGSPELQGALAALERDRLGVTLAGKEGRPEFSVQAGYQNRGGLPGMWQAGVGVRLPVWKGKVASGIAEAEARVRASERRVESVRLALWARTRARVEKARAIEESAALVSKGLLPQDRLAYEAALSNYEAGRAPFLSVLDALGTLSRDRAEELRLLAEHQAVKADLDSLRLDAPAAGASMER